MSWPATAHDPPPPPGGGQMRPSRHWDRGHQQLLLPWCPRAACPQSIPTPACNTKFFSPCIGLG